VTSSTVDVLPGAGTVCRQGEVSMWVGSDVGGDLAARLIGIVTADARMSGADVLDDLRRALAEIPPGAIGSVAAVAVSATGTTAVVHGAAVVQNGRGEARSGALTTQVLHVDLPGDGLVGVWGAASPPSAESGAPGFDLQAGTVRGGGVVIRTIAVPGLAEPPVPPPAVGAVPGAALASPGAEVSAPVDTTPASPPAGAPESQAEEPVSAESPAPPASPLLPAEPTPAEVTPVEATPIVAPAGPARAGDTPAAGPVEPSIIADAEPAAAGAVPVGARLAPDGAAGTPPATPAGVPAAPAAPAAEPDVPPAPPSGPGRAVSPAPVAPPAAAPEPGPPPDPAARRWEPLLPPLAEPGPASGPAAWEPPGPGQEPTPDAWGPPGTPGRFHPGANGSPEAAPLHGPPSPPAQRQGGLRLLDLGAPPVEERPPLSIVRDVVGEPPPVDEPRSVREVVQGIRCVNGHFNHQGMLYCRACGIGMVQQSAVLVEDERPSLGVIVMGDGSTFSLDDEYLLGRERSSDAGTRSIVVNDRRVSRRHAKLSLAGWDVQVTDLGSSNGTYVKNPGWAEWVRAMPHQPVTIEPGGQIGIGGQVLVYESSARRT
jgi:hypothetical protein